MIRIAALLYLTAVCFFGWGYLAVKLQLFPAARLEPVFAEITAYFSESHQENIQDMVKYAHQERANAFNFSGLQKRDIEFSDVGFLLVSRYSKAHDQVIIELIRLETRQTLHTWVPALDSIFAATPSYNTGVNTRAAYRAQHPLLLPHGHIVTGSGEGPLVRLDHCGAPVWSIERHFHHSIELTATGELLVPLVIAENKNDLGVQMRNDGFARVSLDGKILEEYSLYEPLMEQGYRALIYGVGEFEQDRFHLNDVQPVPASSQVLLSIRNLSSIASFDLESGMIQWLKTGPWLNQHDVNPLPDGRVSIFGNDFARGSWTLMHNQRSDVYIYDPRTDVVTTPYTKSLEAAGMMSQYEGRARVLGNGDVYIEETNRDRLLRVSADKIRWEYVNGVAAGTSGAVHWSRYLDAGEVGSLAWLDTATCD